MWNGGSYPTSTRLNYPYPLAVHEVSGPAWQLSVAILWQADSS